MTLFGNRVSWIDGFGEKGRLSLVEGSSSARLNTQVKKIPGFRPVTELLRRRADDSGKIQAANEFSRIRRR